MTAGSWKRAGRHGDSKNKRGESMTVKKTVLASFLFAAVFAEAAALNEIYVDFGYLWFLPPGGKPDVGSLASIMQGRVSAPWCTEIDGVMVYDLGEGVKSEPLSRLMALKRCELDARLSSIRLEKGVSLEREFAALKEKCGQVKAGGDTLGDYAFADEVLGQLNIFYWKNRLESEFGGGK